MKKIILSLLSGILMISLGSFTKSPKIKFESNKANFELLQVNEKYRVTAQTRNAYGTNYWIDIIVEGYIKDWGKKINSVYYDDGYGLKKVSYYKDYEYEDSYYIIIDYTTKYYFKF